MKVILMRDLTEKLVSVLLGRLKEFNKDDYSFRLLGVENGELIIKKPFYRSKAYKKATANLPEPSEQRGLLKKAMAYRAIQEAMDAALEDYMLVLQDKIFRYGNF